MIQENRKTAGGQIGSEHFVKNGECDARFVTEPGDATLTWIQVFLTFCVIGQRIISSVIIADPSAQFAVGCSRSMAFDRPVVVRRNGLGSELAADPFGFFGENDR